MIFAEYDGEGRLCAVRFESISSDEESVFKKEFLYEGGQACVFIWNSDVLTPCSEKYNLIADGIHV